MKLIPKYLNGNNVWYNGRNYYYQEDNNSEQIPLEPLNRLTDNPANWTFTDNQGRTYTPRRVQSEQGEIKQGRKTHPAINAINQYIRLAKYEASNLKNGVVPSGKYTIPAIIATPLMAKGLLSAQGLAALGGGWAGGKTIDVGMKTATGKTWAENMTDWTGLDPEAAEITNPGTWIGGNAWYNGIKTLLRGVALDIADGITNLTISKALLKGSPNLGYRYGIFDFKNNPIYKFEQPSISDIKHPISYLSRNIEPAIELGNYILPFSGPIKTPARWVGKNIMSLSPSPERTSLSLKTLFTEGNYNGVINFIDSDIKKNYPKVDFNRYYLWRKDPILRWDPKVRATAKYFKENPAPLKVEFGEKYNLYGKLPQAKMPVKSVKSHLEEVADAFPEAEPALKTEKGITKVGLQDVLHLNTAIRKLGRKFELNEWQPMSERLNPDVPELNVGGHLIFINSNTGEVISKDIFKFNPADWSKWEFLGGKASQAGILDKLGKPFITVSKNKLSPEASQYLTEHILSITR